MKSSARVSDLLILDKDDLLEVLFAGRTGDAADGRAALSRQADAVFQSAAHQAQTGILISFWRHPGLTTTSGTPSEWLFDLPDVVEVYCLCSPVTAARRFQDRVRHPAHGDNGRTYDQLIEQFTALTRLGPLGIGRVITVDTETTVDAAEIWARIG